MTIIYFRAVAGGQNQGIAKTEEVLQLEENTMYGLIIQRDYFSDLNWRIFV
jgi:hypothetical protein